MDMFKVLGWLFLVGWIAGQLIRLPGEFPVTLLDVAVGGAIIVGGIRGIRGIREIGGIGLILVVSWILGLRLFSWQESIPGGVYLLRFLGYLWIIANAGKLLSPVKKFIIPAFWIFIILAWIQYLFLPDTRFLLRYGWDEHYYRMIGTVLDPNYLGVMLGMIGIYLIYKYTNRQIDKWGKILLALIFGGLVVTYSRASWVAMVVVGIGYFVFGFGPSTTLACVRGLRPRYARARVRGSGVPADFSDEKSGFVRRKLGGLGILGIAGIIGIWLMVPKQGGEGVNLFRTNSIEQRIVSWKEGINVWRGHPWVGVGFNNYKISKYPNGQIDKRQIFHSENAPSSSWILLLATIGIIGIGGLGVIGGIRGIRGEMAKNKMWIGVLMMVGIHAIFNNTMFYPPVLGLLALIKAASED